MAREIHDPHHVAQLAALILTSQPNPEEHHIKKAVAAARSVLDEAFRRAKDDEAKAESSAAEAAEKATAPELAKAEGEIKS